MLNKIAALGLTLAVAVGGLFLAVPTAQASETCTAGTLCGEVNVIPGKGTGEAVYITHNWCGTGAGYPCGPYAYVHPGHTSREFWNDTDGFYVPPTRDIQTYYWTSYGWQPGSRYRATGWVQIHNWDSLGVAVVND